MIPTSVSGETISLTDSASTSGVTVTNMRVSGRHASGMVRDAIPSSQATSMLVSTPGAKPKAMVSTLGRTAIFTQASFSTDRKMDKVAGRKVGMPIPIVTRATTS